MNKKKTQRSSDNGALLREREIAKEKSGSMERTLPQASIRAVEGDGNERKFTLSFSSEEPYERWWGLEILSHEDGAVNLERLNSIGCVLFNHNRDKVIAKVTKAEIVESRGVATIEFDDDEFSEVIRKKVAGGTLKGVSVGYVVDNWEDVEINKTSLDGRFNGPCSIAKRWTPLEVSIVSVPADPTVGVGRSKEDAHTEPEKRGVGSMYYRKLQLQINKNMLKEEK